MKKFPIFIMMLIAAIPALAQINYQENADPKPGAQEVWNNLKQVTVGWGTTDVRYQRSQPAATAKKLSLTAWRGERVSAQAVVSTPSDIKNLTFSVSDLKNGKNVIPAKNIRQYVVGYVLGDIFTSRTDSALYADRLDPIASTPVKANTSRPLWLDIKVPGDVKAGTYRGVLTVNADEKEFKLPFQVNVLDRVLPEPSEWAFHLDIWQNPYAVARIFNVPLWSKEHFDHMRPTMELLAQAGQKVITASIIQHPWNCQTYDPFESMIAKMKQLDGTWKYDYTVFDKWVQFMMDCGIKGQIDCYSLVPWTYTFDYYDCATNSTKTVSCQPKEKAYRDFILPFLRDFAAHLKAKGWFNITCIAMDERPMDQLQAAWDVVKEADPGYRIEGAANVDVSSAMFERTHDLSIFYAHKQVSDEIINSRHDRGQILTFYTCCGPDRPNTFAFSDPAESAYLGWHAAACGYDGYLRWAYNSWPKDPYMDSRFGSWPSADTYLVYPVGSSIRFERLVEGIQAFEKMRILQPELTEKEKQQLTEVLKPFRNNGYDPAVKAHDVVNAGKALLDKLSK